MTSLSINARLRRGGLPVGATFGTTFSTTFSATFRTTVSRAVGVPILPYRTCPRCSPANGC